MTEIRKRILSNIMSLILGAGIGAGVYALKERITEPKMPGIEVSVPEEVGGGGNIKQARKPRDRNGKHKNLAGRICGVRSISHGGKCVHAYGDNRTGEREQ